MHKLFQIITLNQTKSWQEYTVEIYTDLYGDSQGTGAENNCEAGWTSVNRTMFNPETILKK